MDDRDLSEEDERHRKIAEEDIRARIEHRDTLLHIQAMLATLSGRHFVKYLFREFEVTKLPPLGMEGNQLMDKIGSLRAGQAIFEIVAEASPELAASILAQIEKERHAQIYSDSQI